MSRYAKPNRRLFEWLKAQSLQGHQPVTFRPGSIPSTRPGIGAGRPARSSGLPTKVVIVRAPPWTVATLGAAAEDSTSATGRESGSGAGRQGRRARPTGGSGKGRKGSTGPVGFTSAKRTGSDPA